MTDESLKAYLQTREWHWISAGVGAFSGLLTGLFFWWVSPFDLAHATYWAIIGCLMLGQGVGGFFLSNRSASRFESAMLWIAAFIGLVDTNS
jgi:hypothetical protein